MWQYISYDLNIENKAQTLPSFSWDLAKLGKMLREILWSINGNALALKVNVEIMDGSMARS